MILTWTDNHRNTHTRVLETDTRYREQEKKKEVTQEEKAEWQGWVKYTACQKKQRIEGRLANLCSSAQSYILSLHHARQERNKTVSVCSSQGTVWQLPFCRAICFTSFCRSVWLSDMLREDERRGGWRSVTENNMAACRGLTNKLCACCYNMWNRLFASMESVCDTAVSLFSLQLTG